MRPPRQPFHASSSTLEGAGGLRSALPVLRLIGEHFGVRFAPGPPPPDKKADGSQLVLGDAADGSSESVLVLARILSGFTVGVGGLVLLLCAHLFYTFQGRPFWLAMDAGLIALATIAIVGQLARLEKDPILSRLWGTSPGRLSWAGGSSPRMIVYTTVAVLTVFASLFPEVGSVISGWVEPVRKSLP